MLADGFSCRTQIHELDSGGHEGIHLAELLARRLDLARVIVTLSNDNIPAQYFYLRRGYRVTRVLPGAIAAQPQNQGLVGFADIPIVDELQLSKDLQP